MLSYFTTSELAIFLSILTPTACFCALNQQFFSNRQLVQAIFLAFLVSTLTCFLAILGKYYLKDISFVINAQKYGISFFDMIYSLLAITFFIVLHERFFTESIQVKKYRVYIIAGIYILFALLATIYSLAPLNIILLLMIFSSFIDAYKNFHKEKQIVFESNLQNIYYSAKETRNITLTHKPNIYFLLLESYHSAHALKKLYDIDDTKIDILLEKHGFIDYKNYYSNRASTVRALDALLNFSLTGSQHTQAFVFDVFRENGYQCEFFDIEYFIFGKYMKKNEYASFYMTPIQNILHAMLAPIWAQSSYLRKLIKSSDPFDIQDATSIKQVLESFHQRLHIKQKHPRFFMARFGADHASPRKQWLKDNSDFIAYYKKRVLEAQVQIADIINDIVKTDPHACILAIGDHGSMRHVNVWQGQDPKQAIKERGVSLEDLALDQFAVRCAIRWPSENYPAELFSHVQIFPSLLQQLGANITSLPKPAENISILKCNAISVRDGKILPELEDFTQTALLEKRYASFIAGTASLQDCMELSMALDTKHAIEVLTWAQEKYPDSAELSIKLSDLLFSIGHVEESLKIIEPVANNKKHFTLSEDYARQLLEIAPLQAITYIDQDPNHTLSADVCFMYACANLKLGNKEKALEYVDIIASKHKNNPNHYYYAICILFTLKNYSQALRITKTLKNNILGQHINNMYHEISTFTYMFNQEWDLAEQANKTACDFRTRISWNWILQAYIYETKGNLDAAFTALMNGSRQADNKVHIFQALGRFAIKYSLNDSELNVPIQYANMEIEAMTKVLTESRVVHKNFYLSQVNSKENVGSVYWHYMNSGLFQGLDFVPWFNTLVYLFSNPHVFWAGLNPFTYFLVEGVQKLQNPSLLHHTRAILVENPKLQKTLLEDSKLLLYQMHKKWG